MNKERTHGSILHAINKTPGAAETARARHRRVQLPCDTHLTSFGPLIRALARAAEVDMKNKAYQACPVGQTVARYLRAIEYGGLAASSIESYEQVLAWLAQAHDDLDDVARFCDQGGADLLEEFLHVNWGRAAENTRAHRWTVLKLFFAWCKDKALVPFNPMEGIRRPRNPRIRKERVAYEPDIVRRLIDAQEPLRDRCALGLLRLALRKNDLRMLQLRDIDLVLDVIRLNHAKGGKRHQLPIVFDDLRRDLAAHIAERTLELGADPSDEYLLYPKTHRGRPMDAASVHRWFKNCLTKAGLAESVQMHELRHTAADNIWRQTGNIVIAQQLLRHESPATTALYLHPTADDLRAGLKVVEEAWGDVKSVRSGVPQSRPWSHDDL